MRLPVAQSHAEALLWLGALGFLVAGIVQWRRAGHVAESQSQREVVAPPLPSDPAREELEVVVDSVVERNPFRLNRRPSDVAYTPEAEGAPPPPPKPARPVLVVSGIIGGPPWEAVLEGVPGRQGPIVVRMGDKLDLLTVRRIGRDTVYIVGKDTTWKLTVRRGWR